MLHVADHAVEYDSGAAGPGGIHNSNAVDDYSEIDADLDGLVDRSFSYRRLGDVNGDGVVSQSDVLAIGSTSGLSEPYIGTDVRGTGEYEVHRIDVTSRELPGPRARG